MDAEIRPQITSLATKVTEQMLGSHRFKRFSNWKSLVRAMKMLIHIARSFSKTSHTGKCTGWHCCNSLHPMDFSQAKTLIQCVQHVVYKAEFESLAEEKEVHPQSPHNKLDPFTDQDALLRVGGHLQSSDLSEAEKHPLIIPASHHVAVLLVRHYHDQVAHQGHQFSEGALRTVEM